MKKILLYFSYVGVFVVFLIIGSVFFDDSDQYDLIETIELSPEQKKEVCQKLKSSVKKASADTSKASAHENESLKKAESKISFTIENSGAENNASAMSKGYVETSVMSRAYADMVKYKCFKDTHYCIKALKNMRKGYADLNKYYANNINQKPKPIKINVAAGSKVKVDLKEIFADYIKAAAAISKASANKEKYCKYDFDDNDQSSNDTGDWMSPEQKKSEVCKKIKSDFKKLYVLKANDHLAYSKDNADWSKRYADAIKYKCFKDTLACIEALKDNSKVNADMSQAYADMGKANAAISKADAERKKVNADMIKVNADMSQAYAAISKANAAISKANAEERKVNSYMIKVYEDKSKAYLVMSQAYADMSQAYPAKRKANAGMIKVYEDKSKAYLVMSQAYLVMSQAYPAKSKADADFRKHCKVNKCVSCSFYPPCLAQQEGAEKWGPWEKNLKGSGWCFRGWRICKNQACGKGCKDSRLMWVQTDRRQYQSCKGDTGLDLWQ